MHHASRVEAVGNVEERKSPKAPRPIGPHPRPYGNGRKAVK